MRNLFFTMQFEEDTNLLPPLPTISFKNDMLEVPTLVFMSTDLPQ